MLVRIVVTYFSYIWESSASGKLSGPGIQRVVWWSRAWLWSWRNPSLHSVCAASRCVALGDSLSPTKCHFHHPSLGWGARAPSTVVRWGLEEITCAECLQRRAWHLISGQAALSVALAFMINIERINDSCWVYCRWPLLELQFRDGCRSRTELEAWPCGLVVPGKEVDVAVEQVSVQRVVLVLQFGEQSIFHIQWGGSIFGESENINGLS